MTTARNRFRSVVRDVLRLDGPSPSSPVATLLKARHEEVLATIDHEIDQLEDDLQRAASAETGTDEFGNDELGGVLDSVANFVQRYCDGGDYSARRRFRDGTYALPYQGEETYLHWAHRNQHYIRTDRSVGGGAASGLTEFFLHEDLQKFLNAELDYYLRNEMLDLDDLEQNGAKAHARLSAVRRLGSVLIGLLAQIERVQLGAWLRPKAVIEHRHLIPLEETPTELDRLLLANKSQLERWSQIAGIEATSLSADVLREHPSLMVDTGLFDRATSEKLANHWRAGQGEVGGVVIKSDNYQALRMLQAGWSRGVDVVFIDPPYNTGHDGFVYKDRFRHATWLTMMERRLRLARELLTESGSIFVAIDDNEHPRLRILMDQVFGATNFIANFVWWGRRSVSSDAGLVSLSHHHVVAYARERRVLESVRPFVLPADTSKYANPDNDRRGPWLLHPFDAPNIRPNLTYPIVNPETGKEHLPPRGRCWRTSREEMERLRASGRIMFGKGGKGRPMLKYFEGEAAARGRVPTTLLSDVGTTTSGTQLLDNMFGRKKLFTAPKPPELVEHLLRLAGGRDSVVLDFFAGSGTTGHAVMNLNREDGGGRRYLLVEMGDYVETLLIPRLQKAALSSRWKKGEALESDGILHAIQVVGLESFEDSMKNMTMRRTAEQSSVLSHNPEFRREYVANELLTTEAGRQANRWMLEAVSHPFSTWMSVERGGEEVEVEVDVCETFVLLLGLTVETQHTAGGVLVCSGAMPDGRRATILLADVDQWDDSWLDKRSEGRLGDNNLDLLFCARKIAKGALSRRAARTKVRSLESVWLASLEKR